MVDEESFLELLDIYMTMVEKQDEIICRMGRMISKRREELRHYKAVHEFVNLELGADDMEAGILEECMEEYQNLKSS